MLDKPLAEVASEVAASDLGDRARALLRPGLCPEDYLKSLAQEALYPDVLRFLAHWLPKRVAVWWGCECIWHIARPQPPEREAAALRAVVGWVFSPDEKNRRAAETASEAAGPKSAVGFLAQAAFYSQGSMSRPGLPAVTPPADLTAKTLAVALMLAVQDAPQKANEHYRQFLSLGIDISHGKALPAGLEKLLKRSGVEHKTLAAPGADSKDVWENLTASEEEQVKIEKAATSKKTMPSDKGPAAPSQPPTPPAPVWDPDAVVVDDEEVAKPSVKDKATRKTASLEPTPPKKKPSRPDAQKEIWDTGISEVGES